MSHDARTQLLSEGAKALLLINGGGIVALLALLATLLPIGTEDEKFYALLVLFSIGFFFIGQVLAAANYFFRFRAALHWDTGGAVKHSRFLWFENVSVLLSFIFFLLGVTTLVLGMLIRIYLGN